MPKAYLNFPNTIKFNVPKKHKFYTFYKHYPAH